MTADCVMPDHQAPHVGITSLFTRVPEQDASVASTDVKIIFPGAYTTCNVSVRALLVDAHQFTETLTTTGSQRRKPPSNKLVLLTIQVTLTDGQLGIFDTGLPTVSTI